MKRSITLAVFLFILAALAAGCNLQSPQPSPDLSLIVAQTQTAIAVAQVLTPAAVTPSVAAATPGAVVPTGQVLPQTSLTPPAAPVVEPSAITPQSTPVTPGATAAPCTLRAKFLGETVPDGAQFAPGQAFVKTWTLQNVGTCTWLPEFAIIYLRGEQMGGTSPSYLGQTVAPNGTVQVFLPQTAPAAPGEHQGFWMLRDLTGVQFALGDDAATPFWVKINVVAGLPSATAPLPSGDLNLGPPAVAYTFDDNKAPFFLGEGDDVRFDLLNGDLVLTAIEPAGDLWRVAERSGVDDFAIEARFRTGANCSGKDDYGLLVRAPSQPDDIIDSGYVFGFNCEGQYRVYRMDGGGYTGIQSWKTHSALQPGPSRENVMVVRALGDLLQFFANGTLLYEFQDRTYSSGLWGLMVGSAGTRNFQVGVASVSIWDLP